MFFVWATRFSFSLYGKLGHDDLANLTTVSFLSSPGRVESFRPMILLVVTGGM